MYMFIIQFTVLLIVPYMYTYRYCFHIVLCNWTFCIDHCKYYYLCIVTQFELKTKMFYLFSMLYN